MAGLEFGIPIQERLNVTQAVGESVAKQLIGLHPERGTEGELLRKFFDRHWDLLDAAQDEGSAVEFSDDWMKKYQDISDEAEKNPKVREAAIKRAKDYALLCRALGDKTFQQRNAEEIAGAQERIMLARGGSKGDRFEQYIAFGMESWANEEIARQTSMLAGTAEMAPQAQPAQTADANAGTTNTESAPTQQETPDADAEDEWKSRGWDKDVYGEMPIFSTDKRNGILQNTLVLIASIYASIKNGYIESGLALKEINKIVTELQTRRGVVGDDLTTFMQTYMQIKSQFEADKGGQGFSFETIDENAYSESEHGRLPEGIKDSMVPYYKKLLILKNSPEWKKAVKDRSESSLRRMAARLGTAMEALVGSEKIIDGRIIHEDGADYSWVRELEVGVAVFRSQRDQMEASGLTDEEKEQQFERIESNKNKFIKEWRESRELVQDLIAKSWNEIYDESKFGIIPHDLMNPMIPIYQYLTMVHEKPDLSSGVGQKELRALAIARKRLQAVDYVRLQESGLWWQTLKSEEIVDAWRGVDNPERRLEIKKAIEKKWDDAEEPLRRKMQVFADEVRFGNEDERVDTLRAFLIFARDKGAFGDYEHMTPQEQKNVDDRMKRLINAENLNDPGVKKEFDDFKSWMRGWMVSELSDVMDTNQNSFISAMGQVSARLKVSGLENDIPIISIITAMGNVGKDRERWNAFGGELIRQLQVMSAIHNRERLYARVKNITPDEIVKAMVGIASQGAGRGESLGMDADSWSALFEMDVISTKENTLEYGETVREAMAIFLLQERDKNGGALTVENLLKGHFSREAIAAVLGIDLDINTDWPQNIDMNVVVIQNIFPIESRTTEQVRVEKEKMAKLLYPYAKEGSVEQKAARLAVGLAYKAMEVGFVGAGLDSELTGKEVIFRELFARTYRARYSLTSREAGLTLTIPAIDACLLTYFDTISFKDDDGVERTLREWILGIRPVMDNDRRVIIPGEDTYHRSRFRFEEAPVAAKNIRFKNLSQTPDYLYYDSALKWGNDIWNYLIKGLGVSWTNPLGKGAGVGNYEIYNPEFVTAIREFYKKVGYFVACYTPYQLQAMVMPGDFATLGTPMNEAYSAWYRKLPQDDGSEFGDRAFRSFVQVGFTRRMVLLELAQYGVDNNPVLQRFFTLRRVLGARIEQDDRENIQFLLENVSQKPPKALEAYLEDIIGASEMAELFSREVIEDIFEASGIKGGSTFTKDALKIANEVVQTMHLVNAGRRH